MGRILLVPLGVWKPLDEKAIPGDLTLTIKGSVRMIVRLIACLALLFSSLSFARGPEFEETALTKLITAIQNGSHKDFTALGDERFQAMPEKDFEGVVTRLGPLLQPGYQSSYLGDFKIDKNTRVYYWKLELANEPHDWLAKMAVADDKVKGFFIVRP